MTRQQADNTAKKIRTAIAVGAVGGLFWSFVNYVLHYLNFTLIGPSVLIQPFAGGMGHRPWAHFIGMGVAAIVGIIFGLIYVFLFSRYYQPFIGVGCGLLMFGVFFYLLNPILKFTQKGIHQLGMNTFTTELCIFILFGLFVGFSLSVEFSSKEKTARAK